MTKVGCVWLNPACSLHLFLQVILFFKLQFTHGDENIQKPVPHSEKRYKAKPAAASTFGNENVNKTV
jgi:hypothetical protein